MAAAPSLGSVLDAMTNGNRRLQAGGEGGDRAGPGQSGVRDVRLALEAEEKQSRGQSGV